MQLEQINKSSYEELLEEKQRIKQRMIELHAVSSSNNTIGDADAYKSRKNIELHWDNVMKEMVL